MSRLPNTTTTPRSSTPVNLYPVIYHRVIIMPCKFCNHLLARMSEPEIAYTYDKQINQQTAAYIYNSTKGMSMPAMGFISNKPCHACPKELRMKYWLMGI